MTQPNVPEYPSVEYFADRIRTMTAEGHDLYPYAFGLAAGYAMLPNPPADALQRIANIGAAVKKVNAERLAAYRASSIGLDYCRSDGEPDDPTPVSPARMPLHVGAVGDGGLVDETPVEAR